MARPTLDVLLYHDVSDDGGVDARSNPAYTTSISRLERHLELLRRRAYRFLRTDQWLDLRSRKEGGTVRWAMLTFDGPHVGWFTHVVPLLCRTSTPATFFITSAWVGEAHPFPESRSIRWSDVRELLRHDAGSAGGLFDLGCHSMTHAILSRSPAETDALFARRLRTEIVTSTEMVRTECRSPVRAFAPPKGRGSLVDMAEPLREARVEAVRWASMPGATNAFEADPFNLQIRYCDHLDAGDHGLRNELRGPAVRILRSTYRRARRVLALLAGRARP